MKSSKNKNHDRMIKLRRTHRKHLGIYNKKGRHRKSIIAKLK